MKKGKINGFSYQDFEQIGIPADKIYPLAKKYTNKRDLLEQLFQLKFNKGDSDKVFRMILYYGDKVQPLIKKTEFHYGTKNTVSTVREDLYLATQLFGYSQATADRVWDRVMSLFYLN